LDPPTGSVAGDEAFFEGYETGKPDETLNPKKKIWKKLQVDLNVNANGEAQWQSAALMTSSEPITAQTLRKAPIQSFLKICFKVYAEL
jgi:tyrosyl-tRNA synthetase